MIKRICLSIIILTYNEEKNIRSCLESIHNWAGEIFIVDSYSTDRTIEISKNYTNKIYQHEFKGYAGERNWALKNLPFSYDWVFFLDADEMPSSALKKELNEIFSNKNTSNVQGLYIKRKFIFLGTWIKHGGYYPTWHLRIFKHKRAWCRDRKVDEHFEVRGKTIRLHNDIIHENKNGLSHWIAKHNKYASLEALEQLERNDRRFSEYSSKLELSNKSPGQRKRQFYYKLPYFLRSFLYFVYRYFLKGGFMDGKAGLVYHFLQSFWFRFLVDAKIYERKQVGIREGDKR